MIRAVLIRSDWQKIAVWERVLRDIAGNIFGISATALAVRLAVVSKILCPTVRRIRAISVR